MSSTGAGFEFEPFSKKQLKLLYWWADGSPYKDRDIMIADGSIRSGKTIACICSFLMFVFLHFTAENFIIAGKTIGALKRNVIKPITPFTSLALIMRRVRTACKVLPLQGRMAMRRRCSRRALRSKCSGAVVLRVLRFF